MRDGNIVFLFLNQIYVVCTQKNGSFEHLKHMHKWMDKKIIKIVCQRFGLMGGKSASQFLYIQLVCCNTILRNKSVDRYIIRSSLKYYVSELVTAL